MVISNIKASYAYKTRRNKRRKKFAYTVFVNVIGTSQIPNFMTWKNLGHLASGTEFVGTPGQICKSHKTGTVPGKSGRIESLFDICITSSETAIFCISAGGPMAGRYSRRNKEHGGLAVLTGTGISFNMRGVTVQVRSGAGGTTRTPRTKKI
jgi:hypothetical protein